MADLTCINDYLKSYGPELGHRVVDQFPPPINLRTRSGLLSTN